MTSPSTQCAANETANERPAVPLGVGSLDLGVITHVVGVRLLLLATAGRACGLHWRLLPGWDAARVFHRWWVHHARVLIGREAAMATIVGSLGEHRLVLPTEQLVSRFRVFLLALLLLLPIERGLGEDEHHVAHLHTGGGGLCGLLHLAEVERLEPFVRVESAGAHGLLQLLSWGGHAGRGEARLSSPRWLLCLPADGPPHGRGLEGRRLYLVLAWTPQLLQTSHDAARRCTSCQAPANGGGTGQQLSNELAL